MAGQGVSRLAWVCEKVGRSAKRAQNGCVKDLTIFRISEEPRLGDTRSIIPGSYFALPRYSLLGQSVAACDMIGINCSARCLLLSSANISESNGPAEALV